MRRLLAAGGVIATAAGLHTAVTGGRSVAGHRRSAGAALESELRFYGTFYAAYGVAMLRAAARDERDPAAVRAFAAPLFAAGVARAGAWRAAGRPSPEQVGLLAVELAGPPLVVWRTRRPG